MSYLVAAPEAVLDAGHVLAGLNSTISAAHTEAAARTTNLLAAAEDEVSVAIAAFPSDQASAYQVLSARAEAFHAKLVQALDAGAAAYATAESAAASTLKTVSPAVQTGIAAPAADVAIIMGPSGFPVPPPLYLRAVMGTVRKPVLSRGFGAAVDHTGKCVSKYRHKFVAAGFFGEDRRGHAEQRHHATDRLRQSRRLFAKLTSFFHRDVSTGREWRSFK